jgi:hypothetical protein
LTLTSAGLAAAQLGGASVTQVVTSLIETLRGWSDADKEEALLALLASMSGSELAETGAKLVGKLGPKDRQAFALAVFKSLDQSDLLELMPKVLPASPVLAVLREKLASREFLLQLTNEKGEGKPADFVASLYRVLEQPTERCNCLLNLCKHNDFGQQELEVRTVHISFALCKP